MIHSHGTRTRSHTRASFSSTNLHACKFGNGKNAEQTIKQGKEVSHGTHTRSHTRVSFFMPEKKHFRYRGEGSVSLTYISRNAKIYSVYVWGELCPFGPPYMVRPRWVAGAAGTGSAAEAKRRFCFGWRSHGFFDLRSKKPFRIMNSELFSLRLL